MYFESSLDNLSIAVLYGEQNSIHGLLFKRAAGAVEKINGS